jgi:hypothetical protein
MRMYAITLSLLVDVFWTVSIGLCAGGLPLFLLLKRVADLLRTWVLQAVIGCAGNMIQVAVFA